MIKITYVYSSLHTPDILKVFTTSILILISFIAFSQKGQVIYTEGVLMKSLNRERTIRIYLPPNYEQTTKSYPVIYMHDGQNLFADSTSFVGEWHVDETLDSLYQTDELEVIVVGIDNGGQHRIDEYTAWTHEKYGGGQGAEYADFVAKELKPMIDSTYRTQVNETAVIGSSLGGLISHYMIFKYPDIFNKAGIFSPSYWFSNEVKGFTEQHKLTPQHRVYNLMGDKEGAEALEAFSDISANIGINSQAQLKIVSVKGGEHNEQLWSEQLAACLLWLFKE